MSVSLICNSNKPLTISSGESRQLKFVAPNVHEPLLESYSNAYGSDYIAARYCGFERPPHPPRGLWQHSWSSERDPLVQPDQIFGVTMSHLRSGWYWVSTKFLESYLRSQGFPNVRAIGLPIIYVPESQIERREGSLLVMPVHSLETTRHDWQAQPYVDTIASIREEFREIVVCVSAQCWANGYWVPEFQAAGFKVIRGVDGRDPLMLERMANLFKEFEFVTTNGYGSLLAYAACFGAKVSIFGPYADYTPQSQSTAAFYVDNPIFAELFAKDYSEEALRKRYPEFFRHPAEAVERTEWGRSQLGWENKLSPDEIRHLFGWTLVGRMRARMSIYVRWAKALTPEPVKWRLKAMVSPQFRTERQEKRRLELMPRYTHGCTRLFGRTFEFVDAPTYLEMHDYLFTRQMYRFAVKTDKPLIIDGGAKIGLSILYFRCLYPNSRIIAFEAYPGIFEVLERNCKTYELDDVELIPKALWKCETFLAFQEEGSLAGPISATGQTPKTVSVPTCRLSDYLHEPVDLLKLDSGGAETEVLLDCAPLLKNVANIFVEHHSFLSKPQDLHVAINLLHEAGFRVFVEAAAPARQPLIARTIVSGVDVQVHIFGFRV